MPRGDRIMFKYQGDGSEFHAGIPARDLLESDMDTLTDEQMVTLSASSIYSARGDAPAEAAKAEKRIEKAADEAPLSTGIVTVPAASAMPEPKAEAKK